MAKMGRPLINDEARNAKLTLRLTQAEKDKIGEVAAKIGTSRINAIIKGIELLEQQLDDKFPYGKPQTDEVARGSGTESMAVRD